MNLTLFLIVFIAYTAMLFTISWYTARKADSNAYFRGNRQSPWFIVAYGMIGTSLSGVTYISVPGNVINANFYYMPLVLGFVVGYAVIALVLLPLYYRMNLTSIYTYLEHRFGMKSYRTGASFFILSRVLGATVRIFLVVLVLHSFLPGSVAFWVVAAIFMLLIFLYTFKGGIKTIIWTDTLQTTFMLLAVILTVVAICGKLGWNFSDMVRNVAATEYSSMFNTDWSAGTHFLKQFIAGIFITITMTGLDQEMMQKNISCKNIRDAQKNVFTTSGILVVVNFLFLVLGAVLVLFMQDKGIHIAKSDQIFGTIATNYLGTGVALLFVVGLISASYPSAGGALTSLTTSFCIDFIRIDKKPDMTPEKKTKIRYRTHSIFTVIFFLLILMFYVLNNQAVIDLVYIMASYTYGPLLGMFFFGILTRYKVNDAAVPYVAVASPLLCLLLDWVAKSYFDFGFGFTILIMNGLFTFTGLYLTRKKGELVHK